MRRISTPEVDSANIDLSSSTPFASDEEPWVSAADGRSASTAAVRDSLLHFWTSVIEAEKRAEEIVRQTLGREGTVEEIFEIFSQINPDIVVHNSGEAAAVCIDPGKVLAQKEDPRLCTHSPKRRKLAAEKNLSPDEEEIETVSALPTPRIAWDVKTFCSDGTIVSRTLPDKPEITERLCVSSDSKHCFGQGGNLFGVKFLQFQGMPTEQSLATLQREVEPRAKRQSHESRQRSQDFDNNGEEPGSDERRKIGSDQMRERRYFQGVHLMEKMFLRAAGSHKFTADLEGKVSLSGLVNKLACPICFRSFRLPGEETEESSRGDYTYHIVVPKCGHIMCHDCLHSLGESKMNKCPSCRIRMYKCYNLELLDRQRFKWRKQLYLTSLQQQQQTQ